MVEKAAGPVTVTKNGYSKFVVMRAADYDAMAEENALARLMTRMETAERERAEHAGRDPLRSIGRHKGADMAYKARILPTAEAELESISAYLLQFGPATAARFMDEYGKQLDLLAFRRR